MISEAEALVIFLGAAFVGGFFGYLIGVGEISLDNEDD